VADRQQVVDHQPELSDVAHDDREELLLIGRQRPADTVQQQRRELVHDRQR